MRVYLAALIVATMVTTTCAATPPAQPKPVSEKQHKPKKKQSRIWYAAQWNLVTQHNPAFAAAYSGPNSFMNIAGTATSSVETLFLGIRLTPRLEFLYDEETSAGSGLSGTVGLAGFPNLDAVRAGGGPALTAAPYPARGMLHWNLGLGGGQIENTPNFLELAQRLDRRRLEFYLGKMSLADFFDTNDYANSDHQQFLNWTADNNGAWDYAANTRGYTYAGYGEYDDGPWTLRFAEALMSKLPNQEFLSLNLPVFRAENAEADWNYAAKSNGTIRVLFFDSHAKMGSFVNALAAWRAGRTLRPDVNAVAIPASEYGLAANWQQAVGADLGVFARVGWNDGAQESYSYTAVNNALETGVQVGGQLWGRKKDHAGIAIMSNGISRVHQQYLAAGGLGFQLGDGGLSYGREQIEELYYNLHVWRWIAVAPDVQFFNNPGYNRARGPLVVYGLRVHVEK